MLRYLTMWLVLILAIVLIIRTEKDSSPVYYEGLADCVAEQSYTHPMDDKFAELENALRLCLERR